MVVKTTTTDTVEWIVEVPGARTIEEARERLRLYSHEWFALHGYREAEIEHRVDSCEEVLQ